MRSIITIMVAALAGCDLPGNTSSTETDGVSTTTSPTSSETATEGMSSTSAPTSTEPSPTTTTGEEPPVTECHDVLGGVGVEPPEKHVGTICQTCSGEDCGCPWGVELAGQCVLDCEDGPCPKDLTCLHLAWDGQDAWGCWPHAEPEPEPETEPEPEPEPPTCTPILDLQGTVIGEVCPSAGCPLGVEPLTGLCLQPCELGCLKGQACMDVVLDQEVVSVCWPSEA